MSDYKDGFDDDGEFYFSPGNSRFEWELEREREAAAFFAEEHPCESCGRPCPGPRFFNEEHQIWIGLDCACNAEYESPTCQYFRHQLRLCGTVSEVQRLMKRHVPTCLVCNHAKKEVSRETAESDQKQRAA